MSEQERSEEGLLTWPSFFKTGIERLQARAREREVAKVSKGLLEHKDITKKHRDVHRAKLTRDFLESEFFCDFLKPLMDEKQALKPWPKGERPNSLDQVAADHLVNSGRAHYADDITHELEHWLRDGDEAQRRLDSDTETRKMLRQLRGE